MQPSSAVRRSRRDWDDLARIDAFLAIMWRDAGTDGWDEAAFFETGTVDLAELMAVAAHHHLPGEWRTALDYGCGVGRMTRAMADNFADCLGVDLSPEMVDLARRLNSDRPNCTFETLSGDGRAAQLESRRFDFVYCGRVLQHLGREEIRTVITSLAGLVAPGGLLVIQLPHRLPLRRRFQPRRHAYTVLRSLGVPARPLLRHLRLQPSRMTALPEEQVRQLLTGNGLRLVEVRSGEILDTGIEDRTYWATRPSA